MAKAWVLDCSSYLSKHAATGGNKQQPACWTRHASVPELRGD
jgi:hypothetical protein